MFLFNTLPHSILGHNELRCFVLTTLSKFEFSCESVKIKLFL